METPVIEELEVTDTNRYRSERTSRHTEVHLLLVGEVAIPSTDDVAIHLCVLQVAPFECIDLSLKVG